jgi:predicted RNA-binding Zn-ribbon protein involved in translation (DUF1610 family)
MSKKTQQTVSKKGGMEDVLCFVVVVLIMIGTFLSGVSIIKANRKIADIKWDMEGVLRLDSYTLPTQIQQYSDGRWECVQDDILESLKPYTDSEARRATCKHKLRFVSAGIPDAVSTSRDLTIYTERMYNFKCSNCGAEIKLSWYKLTDEQKQSLKSLGLAPETAE